MENAHQTIKLLATRKGLIIPLLLFLAVFGLYAYTSSPGATNYADSSELITASYILGIPHPPGYPVFVLVGKLFSFLPIGEIAFRYALMSSLLGALTTVLVYGAIHRILQGNTQRPFWEEVFFVDVPSVTGSLSLAFSYVFWLYSIVPEVWVFNSFFTALLLYLGVSWYYGVKNNAYPFFIALTFSLAFLSQQAIVLLIPAFLYLIWVADRDLFWPSLRWAKVLPGFLVGLLPILYFPISTLSHYSIIDFGNARSVDAIWKLLSRHYYGQSSPTGHAYWQPYWNLDARLGELPHYAASLAEYLTIPMLVLGVFGVVWLLVLLARGAYKDPKFFIALAFLVSGVIFAMYTTLGEVRLGASYNVLGVNERMYIMGVVVSSFLVGFGVNALLRVVRWSKYLSVPVIALGFTLLPLYSLYLHFPSVNKHAFFLGEDQAYNLFVNLEPRAILFVRGDSPTFAALYYQYVKKERLDVTVVSLSLPPWAQEQFLEQNPGLWDEESKELTLIIRDVIKDNIGKRPLYFTGLTDEEILQLGLLETPYALSPRGMVNQVGFEFDPRLDQDYWGTMRWRHSDVALDHRDWFAKELIEQYMIGHYNSFSWYMRYGYYDLAAYHLGEMQRRDPHYVGASFALSRFGKEGGQGYKEKDPRRSKEELLEESREYIKAGNKSGALGVFAYLVELEPDNTFYRLQLARTYEQWGWRKEAKQEFLKILEIDPNHQEAKEGLERYKPHP